MIKNLLFYKAGKWRFIIILLALLLIVQIFYMGKYKLNFFTRKIGRSFPVSFGDEYIHSEHYISNVTSDEGLVRLRASSSKTTLIIASIKTPPAIVVQLLTRIETDNNLTVNSNASESDVDMVPATTTTTITTTEVSPTDSHVVLVKPDSEVWQPVNSSLPMCDVVPPVLVGPIRVWFDKPTYEELAALYPKVGPGGHDRPEHCQSRHRVAIVIPYRDRDLQLRTFLHNMHSLMHKQQLDYAIYIIEPIQNQTFNRAKLMNVGYAIAAKQYDWQCYIFHDVDLLPEDDRNIYSCPEYPRHMSVAVDKFKYKLPYSDIFGGITALKAEHFVKVNGYSNDFWGWGGEDDEMASRVKTAGLKVTRYPKDVARYKMIRHSHEGTNPVNKCRFSLMYKVKQRWKKDGISSLNYDIVKLDLKPSYTWALVDLREAESKARLKAERVCR